MAIGINDLDDDDFGMGFEPQPNEEKHDDDHQQQQQVENNNNDDFVADYLKTRGIDDISKIKFEDDNGNIEERDWNSLSKEEKINILNTPLDNTDSSQNNIEEYLSPEEIQFLSELRKNNLTPEQFVQQIKEGVEPSQPQYKIDELSDDELFILDLESRVGELSDEEAAEALNNAKQNEQLFNKQVEGIRKEYKEREDFQSQQEQAAYEQEQEEAYNKFKDSIVESIGQFDSVGNLNLNFDDSDREELAEFILSKDESGNNYLWQALQDPETLVKAAWFILNGDEAFNSVADYFTNQIKLVSENQYKKGFEEGKSGKNSSRPTVVINNKQNNQRPTYNSIDDLDDDN